jgi:phosphoribosylaminoimidazole carboxylase PurE protein
MEKKPKVLIIMGSASDFRIMKKAVLVCRKFEVPYRTKVTSAHRTPDRVKKIVIEAEEDGVQAIVAGAGRAAHLAGMAAAHAIVPVIGVPISSGELKGLDALLSTVQMPEGVPVATVAIDEAGNAALIAIKMLALHDKSLCLKLMSHRAEMVAKVEKDSDRVEDFSIGPLGDGLA